VSAAAGRWPVKPVVVSADVRWIACKDVCVPGRAAVSRELLPGLPAKGGDGAASVERARASVPGPPPKAWRVAGAAANDTFTIIVETGKSERDVTFFPAAPGQVDAGRPVEATPTPRGATLTLRKSAYLSNPIASLKGVIVIGGRGYTVDVPLRAAASPPEGGTGAANLPR
jgi:thiol:disulfide interchange protein DsbD